MDFANPFTAPGRWYKGSLHVHTTKSDGQLEPGEVIRRYRQAGYDFVAITDHGTVTEAPGVEGDDYLSLLGVELDGDRSDIGESVHVVGFGLTRADLVPENPTVPEAITWVKQRGGEALIAHPAWSGLVVSDLVRWQGHLGVEIYNTGCDFDLGKGYSTAHWDDALGRNLRMWGFAVDDAHHRPSDRRPTDTARAWVMVKATELSREAVLRALREGLFYSSWGPTIHDISVSDGVVTASTSPVKKINFIAQRWAGGSAWAMAGPTISQASYRLEGHEQYLRVECRDLEGRWAWSNPMFFV